MLYGVRCASARKDHKLYVFRQLEMGCTVEKTIAFDDETVRKATVLSFTMEDGAIVGTCLYTTSNDVSNAAIKKHGECAYIPFHTLYKEIVGSS